MKLFVCLVGWDVLFVISLSWINTHTHTHTHTHSHLHTRPFTQKRVKNGDTKTVCCWCCQSRPITASCWLPKSGYVPGETIVFCGHVENLSKSALSSTAVQLVEKTIFKAQGKLKENVRLVGDMTRSRGHNPEEWDHFPITMPALPPSGLPHCTIIELSYVLQVIVD